VESCICSWLVWVTVAGKQLSVVVQLHCGIKVEGYGGKVRCKVFPMPTGVGAS
jgi:hypothetical protein